MSTEFDSFDGSALGEFIESPLGERNAPEKRVLIWPIDFSDQVRALYESMGLHVDTPGHGWTGKASDYGLILFNLPGARSDAAAMYANIIEGMSAPGRVFFSVDYEMTPGEWGGFQLGTFKWQFGSYFIRLESAGHALSAGNFDTGVGIVRVDELIGGVPVYRDGTPDPTTGVITHVPIISAIRAHGVEWVGAMPDAYIIVPGYTPNPMPPLNFLRNLWNVPGPQS